MNRKCSRILFLRNGNSKKARGHRGSILEFTHHTNKKSIFHRCLYTLQYSMLINEQPKVVFPPQSKQRKRKRKKKQYWIRFLLFIARRIYWIHWGSLSGLQIKKGQNRQCQVSNNSYFKKQNHKNKRKHPKLNLLDEWSGLYCTFNPTFTFLYLKVR